MPEKFCSHHEQKQQDIITLYKMAIPSWLRTMLIASIVGVAIYGVKTYVTREEYNKDLNGLKQSIREVSIDVKELIKSGR